MWPFSKIKSLKNENTILSDTNAQLERELDVVNKKLNDFTVKKSLGRLIEVPRKIGDTLYVIMKRDAHPEYDCELIGMRRSDNIPENNIKIISITIVGYVIQQSGTYIAFREQYNDTIYHINVNSPNLFLTMDAALGEMYSDNNKKKYSYEPFVVLKQEDVLKEYNDATMVPSTSSTKLPINNLDFIN